MPVLKLTEAVVKALSLPKQGQQFVYDTALKGFGIRLSRETKSFIAERRLHGKTRRITVGPHPQLSVEKARKTAQVILGELVQGIDRAAEKEAAAAKGVTLGEAYIAFKQARKDLRPGTVRNYECVMNTWLADWAKKPWITITPTMVMRKHADIGKTAPVMANLAMRVLSAVFRFAMNYWSDAEGNPPIGHSPIAILSRANAWFPEVPRSRIIKNHQLASWWIAVQSLNDEVARDYFTIQLLTGLRRTEAATLKWSQIDLEQRTITLSQTKNGKAHILPIPDYLLKMLTRTKEQAISEYVFPGPNGEDYFKCVSHNVRVVTKTSGVHFGCHDLRRTFATIADSLEISANAVKRLLNHSSAGDVTLTHYIHMDVERLRSPMQRIEDFILKSAGMVASAEVVQLPSIENQAVA